jgi:hypothetical protein
MSCFYEYAQAEQLVKELTQQLDILVVFTAFISLTFIILFYKGRL